MLGEPVPRIIEVDPHDDESLRAFWETEQAAIRADRAHPVVRTWDALHSSVRDPSPYHRRVLLAAVEDGRVVGGADVGRPLQENTHLGELEISVAPGWRRRVVGTALHVDALSRLRADGRTTVIGEAYESTGDPTGALPFARALGFESVHVEDHLVLPLPAPGERVDALRASLSGDGVYEVVSWGSRCPDEYVAAYCAMLTQMNADVPRGEVDAKPVVVDEPRIRTSEERLARSYHQLIAAARRRADGVFAGYSEVLLPHGEPEVVQLDTLVMPAHRGHRLGLSLKLTNLDAIRRDHPDRTTIHTWTAPDNAAMRRTNDRFGFTVAERMHEMQRLDG